DRGRIEPRHGGADGGARAAAGGDDDRETREQRSIGHGGRNGKRCASVRSVSIRGVGVVACGWRVSAVTRKPQIARWRTCTELHDLDRIGRYGRACRYVTSCGEPSVEGERMTATRS